MKVAFEFTIPYNGKSSEIQIEMRFDENGVFRYF